MADKTMILLSLTTGLIMLAWGTWDAAEAHTQEASDNNAKAGLFGLTLGLIGACLGFLKPKAQAETEEGARELQNG